MTRRKANRPSRRARQARRIATLSLAYQAPARKDSK